MEINNIVDEDNNLLATTLKTGCDVYDHRLMRQAIWRHHKDFIENIEFKDDRIHVEFKFIANMNYYFTENELITS